MKLHLKSVEDMRSGSSAGKRKRSPRRLLSANLRTFLVFLVLAFGFWLLQSMQADFTRRIYIPIAYDTLSVNRGISEQIPDNLELEVQDKGIEHLRYMLGETDTIRLSVQRLGTEQEFLGITASQLSNEVNRRLSPTAQVLSQSLTEVRVALYHRKSKRLPIRLGKALVPASGFVLTATSLTPDSITVYGDPARLSDLREIGLDGLPAEPLRSSIALTLTPQLPEGVYSDLSSVNLEVEVEELTEKTFVLPVVVHHQPEGYVLTPLPSSVTVVLTLPRSRFAEMDGVALEASVDYQGAPQLEEDPRASQHHRQLPVEVRNLPTWVIAVRSIPEHIQYVLER